MNEPIEEPLQIRLQNNLSTFSITSFLFYFFYFLIFIFVFVSIIVYFYPDSVYRKIYNQFLHEFSNKKTNITTDTTDTTDTSKNTNTTQEIQAPKNNKISLDEAVDQYMELQNKNNTELGKINYLPPKQHTNKEGWCFIGKDRDFNSCIKVGRNDYCMSGDIYPTKDICINPSLRL